MSSVRVRAVIRALERVVHPIDLLTDRPEVLEPALARLDALEASATAFVAALQPGAGPVKLLDGPELWQSLASAIVSIARARRSGRFTGKDLKDLVENHAPARDLAFWAAQYPGRVVGLLSESQRLRGHTNSAQDSKLPQLRRLIEDQGVAFWDEDLDQQWRLVDTRWLTAHADIRRWVTDPFPGGRHCRFCGMLENPRVDALHSVELERRVGLTMVGDVVALPIGSCSRTSAAGSTGSTGCGSPQAMRARRRPRKLMPRQAASPDTRLRRRLHEGSRRPPVANDLQVTSGGALTTTAGAIAGDHQVGDLSVDRGAAPAAVARANSEALVRDLQLALGFGIGPVQVQKAQEVMQRHRLAADEREKAATVANLRQKWGIHYDKHIGRIHEYLMTLPDGLADQLLGARDAAGTAIFNKPAVLGAMYELASDTLVASDDERDKAAVEQALQSEWGYQYGSNIALLKQWLGTIPQSAAEGIGNARDFEGVAIFNRPAVLKWVLQLAIRGGAGAGGASAGGSGQDLGARRRAIEAMMGDSSSAYYRGPDSAFLQAEYRDLVDRGVSSNSPAGGASGDVDSELREIEGLMRDRNSRYFKGPQADQLQRRYRELLSARGGRR
jgi:hypothetical protein